MSHKSESELCEDDIFRIFIPLDVALVDAMGGPTQAEGNPTQAQENSIERSILELVARDPTLSQREITNRLGQNANTIKYRIRRLKEKGLLTHTGSAQKGEWIRTPRT